jgi:hypothetical protein
MPAVAKTKSIMILDFHTACDNLSSKNMKGIRLCTPSITQTGPSMQYNSILKGLFWRFSHSAITCRQAPHDVTGFKSSNSSVFAVTAIAYNGIIGMAGSPMEQSHPLCAKAGWVGNILLVTGVDNFTAFKQQRGSPP